MNEIEIASDTIRVSDEYHPSYSSPSADIVLLSEDGVKFRVHSSILGTASKFFNDMFRMPRSSAENRDDALPMGESSEILKTLLDIIYPHDTNPVLPSMSFAFVRRLLSAAEKYDLARVTHYVQLVTKTEPFLSRPLEVYALACIFGWTEEAHRLSLQTLNLDLSSPTYEEILTSIDSASLYKLFQLRWKIKKEMAQAVQELDSEEIDEMRRCYCSNFPRGHTEAWECLEMFIRGELDKYPDGSSLRHPKFWSHGGLDKLWNLKCNICDEPVVRKSGVNEYIIDILDHGMPDF
ncbi:hypothetical protein BD410DRAFT_825761 [Rickenella mellea]|uniref:BTB domain-containing protein n=1 Tax=Rickenella mellea TaxID=50990 RepID=A0A4Y7QIH7_9AGAM|nr:hypothetical protein BD410DRAFT_825761 [Rickenella mellea]